MVGDVPSVFSHAWKLKAYADARALGMPKAIVSLLPVVKPVIAAVVNVVQDWDGMAERVVLSVVEMYSAMGVPPVPMVTEPAAVTSPLASTMNLFVPWYLPRT